jgi:hypothetical protein
MIAAPNGPRSAMPSLDALANVRQFRAVLTNTRTFLRSFTAFKAKARRGETVRLSDGAAIFIFRLETEGKSLIGAAKGKIKCRGDLTKPTLPAAAWKPSL